MKKKELLSTLMLCLLGIATSTLRSCPTCVGRARIDAAPFFEDENQNEETLQELLNKLKKEQSNGEQE